MRPVDQAIVHARHGDCWSACLASILELKLEEVPKFMWHFGNGYAHAAVDLWLQSRGLAYLSRRRDWESYPDHDKNAWGAFAFGITTHSVWCVLTGESQNIRGCSHSVVGRIDREGLITVAHDPSPFKRGIKGPPRWCDLLVARLPEYLIMKPYRPDSNCHEWEFC